MFIGGLNTTTTNESLSAYFAQYGDVASAIVMKDPQTGRSPLFCLCINIEIRYWF